MAAAVGMTGMRWVVEEEKDEEEEGGEEWQRERYISNIIYCSSFCDLLLDPQNRPDGLTFPLLLH